MNKPSKADIRAARNNHFTKTPAGLWRHSDGGRPHTRQVAEEITEACLILGVPIAEPVGSSKPWLAVARALADLDERTARIERRLHGWPKLTEKEDLS